MADLQEENPTEMLSKLSAVPLADGEPAFYWIGAMRHPTKSYLMSAPLWFDMEHHMSMTRFFWEVSPENPADKDKLLQFFLGRFGGKPTPVEMVSEQGAARLNFGRNLEKDLVEISVMTPESSQLHFFLNSLGAVCTTPETCAKHFQAIIEVPASDGAVYFVDLRGFLFSNPPFLPQETHSAIPTDSARGSSNGTSVDYSLKSRARADIWWVFMEKF